MNAITLNKEICRLPVINLCTGGVIAHGFAPMFSPDTLSLRALSADNGLLLPASAISFVNDVCVMVQVPGNTEQISSDGLCRLIGEPLEARVGAFSLFRFGEISAAEVASDGSVTSVSLSDGQVLEIPRGNEAPAPMFGGADITIPHTSPVKDETVAVPEFTFTPEPAYTADLNLSAEPYFVPEPAVQKAAPAPEKAEATDVRFTPEPSFTPIRPAAPEPPVFTEPAASAEPAVPDKSEEYKAEEDAPSEKKKKRLHIDWKDLGRRYVPPLSAMIIYFILYFIVALNLFNIVK